MVDGMAQRLAELRKEHGYSQDELAEQIGVSRQAISKWERAESSPDTDNLVALAKLYQTSLDDLAGLAGAADNEPSPPNTRNRSKTFIALAAIIVVVVAAFLVARWMQGPLHVGIIRGEVVDTSPSWKEFVVQSGDDGAQNDDMQCYYVCKITDETRFFDVGGAELEPTWIREDWVVEAQYKTDESNVVPSCAEIEEVRILERDFETPLSAKVQQN